MKNDEIQDYLLLATATSWVGVRGEMKITLYNPESDYLQKNCQFFSVRNGSAQGQVSRKEGEFDQVLSLQSLNTQGKFPKIKFNEIDQKLENETVFPLDLYAKKSDITQQMEEGEYLLSDLIGFTVFSEQKEVVGTVQGFYSNGAQDILSIEKNKNFKTFEVFDLPMNANFIQRVDVENKCIFIESF